MNLKTAKELIPEFYYLHGHYSNHFESSVIDIFIGFKDPVLTREKFRAMTFYVGFPSLPTDEGNYTICAALENKKIVSIKEVIEQDKIEGFDSVDYMDVMALN